MTHQPRQVSFLSRERRLKHYGIGLGDAAPRAALVAATRERATAILADETYGFTIAHDAATAGLGLVYWWQNDNEMHHRIFASPLEDPGDLRPVESTAMACVWELEIIDFERRAWLEDVLTDGAPERYLKRTLQTVVL